MPDREKVIKGLECCTNGKHYELPLCYDCPYSIGVSCMDYICSLHQDALDLLKAQEPQTVSGWVSVKDRLPKSNEVVLVCVYDKDGQLDCQTIAVRYLCGEWDSVDDYFNQCDGDVRYWMPLQEPPKEDDA